MDGITIEQLQDAFGKSFESIVSNQNKQTDVFKKIQKTLGKLDKIDVYLDKLGQIDNIYKLLAGDTTLKPTDKQNSFFDKVKKIFEDNNASKTKTDSKGSPTTALPQGLATAAIDSSVKTRTDKKPVISPSIFEGLFKKISDVRKQPASDTIVEKLLKKISDTRKQLIPRAVTEPSDRKVATVRKQVTSDVVVEKPSKRTSKLISSNTATDVPSKKASSPRTQSITESILEKLIKKISDTRKQISSDSAIEKLSKKISDIRKQSTPDTLIEKLSKKISDIRKQSTSDTLIEKVFKKISDIRKQPLTTTAVEGSIKKQPNNQKQETASSKSIDADKSNPYEKGVEIIIPPKTKVLLEDVLDGAFNKFYERLRSNFDDITKSLLTKSTKTDTDKKPKKGMLDMLKDIFPLVARLLGPVLGALGTIFLGAGAAIGSVALLINGLFDNGPLKGLKKLLGRGGLALASSLIKKGVARLNKAVTTIGRLFFGKAAVDNFFKKATSEVSKFTGKLTGAISGMFRGFTKSILGFFRGLGTKGGIVGKLGKVGGNFLRKMIGSVGKFFSKGLLKRIPLVGTVIGLGFAVSRFMKGDIQGGIIDVMSAVASLVPGIGTAVSIGLDVLNAFLDAKGGGPEGRAKKGGGGITKMILKGVGTLLKKSLKRIPFIGSVIGMGFAISRFMKGDITGGIIDLLSAVAGLVPGVGTVISFGLDVLNAFLDSKQQAAPGQKPKGKLSILGDIIKAAGLKIAVTLKNLVFGILDEMINLLPGFVQGPVKGILKSLGIDLGSYESEKANAAKDSKTDVNANKSTSDTGSKDIQPTESSEAPNTNDIQPVTPETPTSAQSAPPDDSKGISDVHDTMQEHSGMLMSLVKLNKQTAENTRALIAAMQSSGGNNINVNNISNPTTIMSNPVSNPQFRAAQFAR